MYEKIYVVTAGDYVEAEDRDSVIKIASELRAKYLAEKMGL